MHEEINMEEIKIKAYDGLDLYAIYSEAKNPKAMVQIVHGMAEHKERYIPFIQRLNDNGYTCIIIDNRGHGKSVSKKYPYGHIETPEIMVSDQYCVTKYIKERNPKLDLYMFAHSMGTLIARNYLMTHDNEIKALILSGTVYYPTGVSIAILLAKLLSIGKNKYKTSKLLYFFSNDCSFNEDISWLSVNKENIDDYTNDPLCGFKFTNYGYLNLFRLTKNLHAYKKYNVKNPLLRIVSLSGKLDRTTGGTKNLKKTIKTLNRIGYRNTSFIEYDNMKHEILNEADTKAIYLDIFEFLR